MYKLIHGAIYARVSTTDQNCEMQLRELREYVSRRGWQSAGEYVDNAIAAWKIDRWGRSMPHFVASVQIDFLHACAPGVDELKLLVPPAWLDHFRDGHDFGLIADM